MILTPGHGSLPSGHATEAHIVAYVLWNLVSPSEAINKSTEWLEQLMRQAARVAINRTVAGVHFPVDSAAGQLLGLTLGEYFVHRASGQGDYEARQFDGTQFLGANQQSGLDWPVRMLVYLEKPGRVMVAWSDFAWVAKRHGIQGKKACAMVQPLVCRRYDGILFSR